MGSAAVLVAALWLAVAVDHWLGEPPARWHPVVWMGRYLGAAGRRIAPGAAGIGAASHCKPLVAGALAWWAGAAAVLMAAWVLQRFAAWLPPWAAAPLLALALKPLFAWRMLRADALAVEAALGVSLDAGRARLARLVSRDVAALDEAGVREAAIESLAENLNDSVVAPVFWFVLAGLPGAALYRFANTADAMWGYRGVRAGREWEWAGKWAARTDDLLSWLPARLTACLLCIVAPRGRWSPGALRREAARTPSPNGGWPMAAIALLLGVRLGKPGAYLLNAGCRAPAPADTRRAAALAARAVLLLVCCASAMLLVAA